MDVALDRHVVVATADVFREYDPEVDRFDEDGYPWAWSHGDLSHVNADGTLGVPPIKDLVRMEAGNRCVRCGHPYEKGAHGNGEWSPCDEKCDHDGPWMIDGFVYETDDPLLTRRPQWPYTTPHRVYARWRILTVHHLDGNKANCRWWNLVALDQRCHLTIQGKVKMDVPYDRAHRDWFKPYVTGFYAFKYLSQDISRAEADHRQDELLALELRQFPLFNADLP